MNRTTTEKKNILRESLAGIPYIKELKKLDGIKSVNACILMQQIEEHFADKPNGFCMYATPPKSELALYSKGGSWVEKLGMSRHEIETAFAQMGISYPSMTAYNEAQAASDVFKGKYYCRVYRRSNGTNHQTMYYRNHEKVKEAMAKISNEND